MILAQTRRSFIKDAIRSYTSKQSLIAVVYF